ncbi:MAG: sigma-70 family RNA polymerase sigma factor, partial [Phycisphaerales bacterium]|nr:sigma-70 family RNA polymerase sigma factor [Phycisphaerales bacterium]
MFSRSTHITLLERLGGGVAVEGGEHSPRVVDQEAWRAFHERYGELIRAYARMRGVQAADCDDLVQEVMISLARVMQSGFVYDPSKGTFRSYLKTTVVRAIARRARQNRQGASLEESDAASPAAGPGAEEPDQVWEQQWRQHHTRLAMKAV